MLTTNTITWEPKSNDIWYVKITDNTAGEKLGCWKGGYLEPSKKPYPKPWTSPYEPLIPWETENDPFEQTNKDFVKVIQQFMKDKVENNNVINRISFFKFNKETKVWTAQIILPGIKKDKVKVNIEDNMVKVAADTEVYTLGLPANTNKNSLTARLEDGILTLTVKELEKEIKSIAVE